MPNQHDQELRKLLQLVLWRDVLSKPVESRIDNRKEGLWRHPATLLLLGFILTGVVGAGLSALWQHLSWRHQQEYLAREAWRTEMMSTIEEITAEAAESFTAAEDVLYLFSWTWSSQDGSVTDYGARLRLWEESSRKWRNQSKVSRAKLTAQFRNESASEIFDQLISKRRVLGNNIANMLYLFDRSEDKTGTLEDPEITRLRKDSLAIINESTGREGLLRSLIDLLVQDADSVLTANEERFGQLPKSVKGSGK